MLHLKICGLTDPKNIKEVVELNPDYLGFIFYSQSIRNVSGKIISEVCSSIPKTIKKVGIFVDLDPENITAHINEYDLDLIQLYHKDMIPFQTLRSKVKIIKAFNISEKSDLMQTDNYNHLVDYFLFDTKGSKYGGNGTKFNWDILSAYQGAIPFFLSGGISSQDISSLNNINLPTFYGVDINSKFEITDGIKNTDLIITFQTNLKSYENIKYH